MKEYTGHVTFDILVNAEDEETARISVVNKLQFPGHLIANLHVSIRSEEDIPEYGKPEYWEKGRNKDLPDDK